MKPFKDSSFVVAFFGDGADARVINGWDNVLDYIDEQLGETTRDEDNPFTGPESTLHNTDNWSCGDYAGADGDRRFHFDEVEFAYCVRLMIQRITTYGEDQLNGDLLVGIDPSRGEVVINLGEDRTGHIGFKPDQARHLATLLESKANEIDVDQSGLVIRRTPELGAVNGSTCVVCPSLPCPHCGRQWEPPKRGEIQADNPAPYAVPELVEGDI